MLHQTVFPVLNVTAKFCGIKTKEKVIKKSGSTKVMLALTRPCFSWVLGILK